MALQDVTKIFQELARNAETLAGLTAILSQKMGRQALDPAVAGKLEAVLSAIDPHLFDGLTPDEMRSLRDTAVADLRRVTAFSEAPGQAPRWSTADPVILQAQGRRSRAVSRLIAEFAARESSLAEKLSGKARFLDVGSGTGWISISMAQQWPLLEVDGLDIHRQAIDLAQRNIEGEGLSDRITFHDRDITRLAVRAAYSAAFIPFMFISPADLEEAMAVLNQAIETGGWLFVASYRAPAEPLARAVVDLQTTLSGGRLWQPSEVDSLLSQHDFGLFRDIGGAGFHLFAARRG